MKALAMALICLAASYRAQAQLSNAQLTLITMRQARELQAKKNEDTLKGDGMTFTSRVENTSEERGSLLTVYVRGCGHIPVMRAEKSKDLPIEGHMIRFKMKGACVIGNWEEAN